jgi:hypothetical protein
MQRTFPAGFIAPCLPTKTDKLPSGSQWLHEIKHDGFRIIAGVENDLIIRGDTNGDLLDESQSEGMDGHAARLRVPRRANLRYEDHMDYN